MTDWIPSTLKLLHCAFPEGVRGEEYYAVLHLLNDYLSEGNLAAIMATFTNRDEGLVFNDALGAADPRASAECLERVRARLDACGFQQWINEP